MTATPPGETILLVEDDRPIRRLVRRELEEQGYQLLEAGDGEEALNLAAGHGRDIDLLITDIVMPRMDGFTLSERLVESHPQTHVLFLTGLADQSEIVRDGLKESGQAFLLKPFRIDQLQRSVRRVLDAGRRGGRGGSVRL